MPKFLVLRFSSIGDIVLTTPVVRCLKQQAKDAEVHFCTKKSFSPVIEHNPFIDKQFYLDDDFNSLISQLKEEKYDYIIDLHHNLRTLIIKRKLGVKNYSFDKLNIEKWLMVNLRINWLPGVHLVDRYMETVKALGVVNDGRGLDYFLSADDENVLRQLPPEFRNGYAGFVIGAKHFTKQLPAEKIISICKQINQPIVLLGGKEDFEKGEIITRSLTPNPSTSLRASLKPFDYAQGKPQTSNSNPQTLNLFNACGKFSLGQSAALIKHASKIITHDTGLMHVAAAFKKEIASVWGNTIPEFGMAPYYGKYEIQNTKYEIQDLSCRPCTKIGFDKCPKGHFKCMMDLDESKIAAAL